jgi:hypothetical protein
MDSPKSDQTINNLDIAEENKEIELSFEDIFVNLRLVSKIEVGNKLVQNDKYVNIDTSYFQSVTRWFRGANRNNTIKFMSFVFTKAFELNDKLLEKKTNDSIQTLLRLNSDLKNSLTGLTNLKQTYFYDKLVQSEIDVMIDDIQTRLDNNLKQLNFNRSHSTSPNTSASNSVNNSLVGPITDPKNKKPKE